MAESSGEGAPSRRRKKDPSAKTPSEKKVPASRERGAASGSKIRAQAPEPAASKRFLVLGAVSVLACGLLVAAAVAIATRKPGDSDAAPAAAGSAAPPGAPSSPTLTPTPSSTPTPAPRVSPTPPPGSDAAFDEAAEKSKTLLDQGRYAEARILWTDFVAHATGDALAAATLELDKARRLESLESEGRDLTAKLDLAPEPGPRDAALQALAAWWRKHLDDRGLPPLERATKRLLDERHARLVAEAKDASKRLEDAKASLAAKKDGAAPPPTADAWAARLACAKAASEAKPLEANVGANGKTAVWKGLVVTALDAKGFVLESHARRLALGWLDRLDLSERVREVARRATPAERALDLFADACFELDLGRDDEAKALFDERAKLLPGAPVPDVAKIHAARPFHVATHERDGRTTLAFDFADRNATADFAPSIVAGEPLCQLSRENGHLVIRGGVFATAELARALDLAEGPVEIEAALQPTDTGPFVGLDFLADDGSRVDLHASLERGRKVRVAMLAQPAPRKRPVPRPGELEVPDVPDPASLLPPKWRTLDETDADTHGPVVLKLVIVPGGPGSQLFIDGKLVPWSVREPVVPKGGVVLARLGKLGGTQAAFKRLTVVAPLRPGWLRKLQDEFDRVLATELGGGKKTRPRLALPPRTSADDALGLAGLPEAALAAYADARAALGRGDEAAARTALDAAVAAATPFPGALLLRASLEVERDPQHALEDLDQVIAFLPDCHEALGLRAVAWAQLGNAARAQADIDATLALRPDAALAYFARGSLALSGRRPEDPESSRAAIRDLELASALAPDDPAIAKRAALALLVLRGPWPEGKARRKVTEHFVIATDTEPATLDAVATALEEGFARYAKVFPPEGTWRRSEVLVFNTRGAYADWAEQFVPELAGGADGYYDPAMDQLVLFEPLRDRSHVRTLEVTFHEAFHQYARHALPALPVWLDEGLATWFGVDCSPGSAEAHSAGLRGCIEAGWDLRQWARFFVSGYDEFHDGKNGFRAQDGNYARAWVVADLLLRGEGPLRGVLAKLLARLREVPSIQALVAVLDDPTLVALARGFDARARELAR